MSVRVTEGPPSVRIQALLGGSDQGLPSPFRNLVTGYGIETDHRINCRATSGLEIGAVHDIGKSLLIRPAGGQSGGQSWRFCLPRCEFMDRQNLDGRSWGRYPTTAETTRLATEVSQWLPGTLATQSCRRVASLRPACLQVRSARKERR